MDVQDISSEKQVEDFHRRIDSMLALYQQAIVDISARRVLQDLDDLGRPAKTPVIDQGRGVVKSVGDWIWKAVEQKTNGASQRPTIFIIQNLNVMDDEGVAHKKTETPGGDDHGTRTDSSR